MGWSFGACVRVIVRAGEGVGVFFRTGEGGGVVVGTGVGTFVVAVEDLWIGPRGTDEVSTTAGVRARGGDGLRTESTVRVSVGVGDNEGIEVDGDVWLISCVASCGRTTTKTTAATPIAASKPSVTSPMAARILVRNASFPCLGVSTPAAAANNEPLSCRTHLHSRSGSTHLRHSTHPLVCRSRADLMNVSSATSRDTGSLQSSLASLDNSGHAQPSFSLCNGRTVSFAS